MRHIAAKPPARTLPARPSAQAHEVVGVQLNQRQALPERREQLQARNSQHMPPHTARPGSGTLRTRRVAPATINTTTESMPSHAQSMNLPACSSRGRAPSHQARSATSQPRSPKRTACARRVSARTERNKFSMFLRVFMRFQRQAHTIASRIWTCRPLPLPLE
ncbi:hypothetical protein C2E23DRAFT_47734 [Lenzites betulinus]|nr:hypothetical protein C2E23DRAFT_47734 [Lenzites betulinus]